MHDSFKFWIRFRSNVQVNEKELIESCFNTHAMYELYVWVSLVKMQNSLDYYHRVKRMILPTLSMKPSRRLERLITYFLVHNRFSLKKAQCNRGKILNCELIASFKYSFAYVDRVIYSFKFVFFFFCFICEFLIHYRQKANFKRVLY